MHQFNWKKLGHKTVSKIFSFFNKFLRKCKDVCIRLGFHIKKYYGCTKPLQN